MEIVSVNDIHYDYTLLSAQLELSRADPTFVLGPGNIPFPLPLPLHLTCSQVPSLHHLE